jgi:hypothetical protein
MKLASFGAASGQGGPRSRLTVPGADTDPSALTKVNTSPQQTASLIEGSWTSLKVLTKRQRRQHTKLNG